MDDAGWRCGGAVCNLQAVKPTGPFQTMDKFENAVLQIRVRDFYHGAKADRD